jgi:hypothetical protein
MRKRTADFLQGVYAVSKQMIFKANAQQCSTEPGPRMRSVSVKPLVVVRSECRVSHLLLLVHIVPKKGFVSMSQFDFFYNSFLCIVLSKYIVHDANVGDLRDMSLADLTPYSSIHSLKSYSRQWRCRYHNARLNAERIHGYI